MSLKTKFLQLEFPKKFTSWKTMPAACKFPGYLVLRLPAISQPWGSLCTQTAEQPSPRPQGHLCNICCKCAAENQGDDACNAVVKLPVPGMTQLSKRQTRNTDGLKPEQALSCWCQACFYPSSTARSESCPETAAFELREPGGDPGEQ